MPPCRSERLDFLKAANTNGEVSESCQRQVKVEACPPSVEYRFRKAAPRHSRRAGPWVQTKKEHPWKGDRVVEGTALEKRRTRKGTESSNLSLSAKTGVSGNQFFIKVFSVY